MMPAQRPHEKVQWSSKFNLKKNKCILNCTIANSAQYHLSCSKMEPGEVLTNSCQVSGGNIHPDSLRKKRGHCTYHKCQKYFNVGSCVYPIPWPAVCRELQHFFLSVEKLRFGSGLFSALNSFLIPAVQPAWKRNCIMKGSSTDYFALQNKF